MAVAFCGVRGGLMERPGAVVAVDGEILLGEHIGSGEEATVAVLESHLRDGSQLVGLCGQFSAVVWDAAREEIALIIDLLGSRPLYFAKQDGLVLAASELKALIAAGWAISTTRRKRPRAGEVRYGEARRLGELELCAN